MMCYISFVPFYSNRLPVYDKIGYFIHMFAIHVMFLVCPIIVIVHTAINLKNFYESPARGWLFVFALMNIMAVIYYFAIFLKFVIGITKFWKKRKHAEIDDLVLFKEAAIEAETNYWTIWRGDGEGPRRIGTQIDIGTNLYSLLYYSCVGDEYRKAVEGKQPKHGRNDSVATVNPAQTVDGSVNPDKDDKDDKSDNEDKDEQEGNELGDLMEGGENEEEKEGGEEK